MRFRLKVHWPWFALLGGFILVLWTAAIFHIRFYQARADWYASSALYAENEARMEQINQKWERIIALEEASGDISSKHTRDLFKSLAKLQMRMTKAEDRLDIIGERLVKWRLLNP
ncbi:hypothetical protein LCGC14_0394000 [marine sediment metagenome]|uniref:Uncharacterized protein n=1 Tax=marine sediment metagenome TaxID=412755 RepID=A0A0F9SYR0_9ZZZZ